MKEQTRFAQSSAVYFNFTLEHAMRRLKALGYDGIEVWGGRPHAYRDDLNDELARLKALAVEIGLAVCNFIPAQYRYPSLLCSDNERVRRDSIAYITSAMRSAVGLGSPSVSLCPGMVPWDRDLAAGRERLMRSFHEIAEINRDFGLTLLIEPAHRFETNLILTVQDCLNAIAEWKLDGFGVLLDTGHCRVNGEDLAAAVTAAAGVPLHIHLDDNAGDADSHLLPGEAGAGGIDFRPLAEALDRIGYAGFLSLELGMKYIMDPDAACVKGLKSLRKIFG